MKTLAEAKLLFARSSAAGPNNQTPAAECFRSRAELLFARSASCCRQVPLPLLGTVPLDGRGLGGAILPPVAGVIAAPLPSAVAANLAIFRVQGELLLAVLAAALLLA